MADIIDYQIFGDDMQLVEIEPILGRGSRRGRGHDLHGRRGADADRTEAALRAKRMLPVRAFITTS